MKIELKKSVPLYQMVFIAEVDFFRQSPYIELLDGIKTESELKGNLRQKKMPESAIKNIIHNLEALHVINNGHIEDISEGFPEREYGKFCLNFLKMTPINLLKI